jgi:hypothetical protein
MHKRVLFVLSSILVLALAVSCGGGEPKNELPPGGPGAGAAPGGAAAPNATATVSGKITFEGTPPPNEKIQMSSDPYCAQRGGTNPTLETVKVSDGGLENVIVYISNPPNASYPAPTAAVEINQENCHYIPHVFTMQTNQPLKIKNSDMTLHNIHAWAEKNPQYNVGQPVKDMVNETKFANEEVPLPVKCDVHKWMGAFIGVFHHPYHTVSKGGGSYDLKVPPGKYEVVAWHEKYGKQTQMVEVMDNGKAELNFTFKADGKPTD